MALGVTWAVAVIGIEGYLVRVEADISAALPSFSIVGLPDTSLVESRDRIRAATANAGHPLPPDRITVNLSPAGVPKSGTGFDLAVAVAVLAAAGTVPRGSAGSTVHLGELGLDGAVRAVRGVLPAVRAAVAAGYRRVVVASGDEAEARLVPGADVVPVRHLTDVVALHAGQFVPDGEPDPGPEGARVPASPSRPVGDLRDVVGQHEAREALAIAAAGGHHLFMLGPPGAGKSMLASRLPGLLPELDDDEALEVTAIRSVAGTLAPVTTLDRRPPFEDPHHTTTVVALVGGGTGLPRPGAVSRAHRGVLFLDEAPEFDSRVLDALRQPLESGELVIQRARGAARFPARFLLVMAANPCPCGRSGSRGPACECTSPARRRYLGRLSGPLLDRVDLQVELLPVSRAELGGTELDGGRAVQSTAQVAARVAVARAAQRERWAGTGWKLNGEVPGPWLRGALRLPGRVTADADRALDRGLLTVRGYDRVLRVAWTVADLDGADRPGGDHIGLALVLRRNGLRAEVEA